MGTAHFIRRRTARGARPPAGFVPGGVVAGLCIVSKLGEGGLAEVFAARDGQGAELAVKALHAHLAGSAIVRERFRREMELTRRLAGPGIVRVFAMGDHGGRPFFTLERLHGKTLAQRLRVGPLPPPEARRIAAQVCNVLERAHAAGAVHRDLKPENVFLTGAGVKLLDFGAASVAGEMPLTAASRVLGTPGYIAPELWEGDGADARADVYAVGAMLFEMIAGENASPAIDPFAGRRDPPALRELCPEASAEDEALVRRALAPDPEERFLSVRQLLRALEGRRVPPPPPAVPRLAGGEHDVVVHEVVRPLAMLTGRRPVNAVLRRFAARPPRRWRWRLAAAGQAILVAGAARRTAEEIAAVCAQHGVAATVRLARDRSRAEAWLDRKGAALLACAGASLSLAVAMVAGASAPESAAWTAAAALAGYVLSWGFRPGPDLAPLRDLPPRETSLERLAKGVQRRAESLRAASSRAELLAAAEAALQLAQAARVSADDSLRPPLLDAAAELDDALDRL